MPKLLSPREKRQKAADLHQQAQQIMEDLRAAPDDKYTEQQLSEMSERQAKLVEEATTLLSQAEADERSEQQMNNLAARLGGNTGRGGTDTDDRGRGGIQFDRLDAGETEEERCRSFGDFLVVVDRFYSRTTDPRAREHAFDMLSNFYGTSVREPDRRSMVFNEGTAGGYVGIPPDFRAQLMRFADERAIVRPRATVVRINGLEADIPVLDQTVTPEGGSSYYGGMVLRWTGEIQQKPETQPAFRQAKLTAHEISGLVPVSRTLLLKSAISIDALLFDLFGRAVAREEDRTFFRGDGQGKPKGLQLQDVTITTGQRGSATAISFQNATSVWTRVIPDHRGRGVWVVSQSAEKATLEMAGVANAVFHPTGVYTANTDTVNAGPSGVMLYMRPVLVTSILPPLNSVGDFGFYDFSQYLIGDPGLMEIAVSEHHLFGTGQIAFRLIHYVGGMPWASGPLPLDDGTLVSPFVMLGPQ